MDLYGRVLIRVNQLIPIAFAEAYNSFALKRIQEEETQKDKPVKVYCLDKFNTLILLLTSHIYFKDEPYICEIYNFKCLILMRHPEYIINKKNKIIHLIAEMAELFKRPDFKQFASNPDCLFIPYLDFLNKLYFECK
jgi:hypothetical protein